MRKLEWRQLKVGVEVVLEEVGRAMLRMRIVRNSKLWINDEKKRMRSILDRR